ncbi:MAG: PASTA domain-containing protein [Sinomicrobium sp.]|nr:PASTA domain-containing protein [Sinomicrobium sp.]
MNVVRFILSKTFLKHLVLAFLVVVVIVIIALQWLKITTHHGDYIVVPDLAKKTLEEVEAIVEDHGLRYEVLDSADYSPDYPKFSVMAQNPGAGDKVKENRKIYLTLNPSGYRKVTVPNVIQVTRRNAETIIKAVGLRVGEVSSFNHRCEVRAGICEAECAELLTTFFQKRRQENNGK